MFRRCSYVFICVLMLLVTAQVQAELVGHWTLDEVAGTVAADSSGKDHHGEYVGSPDLTIAGATGAYEGDTAMDAGGGSMIVDLGDDLPTGAAARTVALWLNPRQAAVGDRKFMAYGTGSSGQAFTFTVENISNEMSVRYRHWGGNYTFPGITLDEWNHVTVRVPDGAGMTSDVDVFINGVESPGTMTAGEDRVLDNPASPFYVGSVFGSTNATYPGAFDDVRFYNHPLTDGDIKKIILQDIATKPSPASGSYVEKATVNLSWSPGAEALSHDLYLGTDADLVANATPASDLFIGNMPENTTIVGAGADALIPGTTYYWRADAVNPGVAGSPWKGNVWSFKVPPETAYMPTPVNGLDYVTTDAVTLTWEAGLGSLLHTVNFGTDPAALVPGGLQQETSYAVTEALTPGTTYYWRVDEFNPLKVPPTVTGEVWSFTTVPDIAVTDETLLGWWKFDETNAGSAVDHSGHGLHGTISGSPAWVDGVVGGAVELDGATYFSTRTVDDVNTAGMSMSAWIKPTKVHSGTRGILFTRGAGSTTGLNLRATNQLGYHWMAMAESWGFDQGPIITSGEWNFVALVGDAEGVTLYLNGTDLWTKNAVAHPAFVPNSTLEIGRDPQGGREFTGLLDDVRIYTKALSTAELDALVDLAALPVTPVDPMVVDNFDGYRAYYVEAEPNVWDVWADGYGGNNTGSTIGNDFEPFMARGIVQGNSGQSVPMQYNNNSFGVSEISRDFSPAQDLTRDGAQNLVLYIRGDANNLVGETDQVTVVLEDGSKTDTIVAIDSAGLVKASWQKVEIPVAGLSIDATQLKTLRIQVGAPGNAMSGSSGTIYVDNIGLE